jgi:hypothetical protein
MRKALVAAVGIAAAAVLAVSCKQEQRPPSNVAEMSVEEAKAALDAKAVFIDANDDEFRKANGKVPGAVLLANYREYEPAQVLPAQKDASLVFYCSSRT